MCPLSIPLQVAIVLQAQMGREQLQVREDPSLQQAQGAQQSHEAVQADHADSLMGQATAILRQSNPQIKAAQTHRVTKLWEQRQLVAGRTAFGEPPERPGRDDSKVWDHLHHLYATLLLIQLTLAW